MKKRFLALLMAAVLLTALAPAVLAADGDFVIEGVWLRSYKGPGGDVTVPDGVQYIGDHAFQYTDVTSVTIPEGVYFIDNYAFEGCKSLTGVTLPASLNSIGRGIFDGCTSLKTVNLAPGNETYTCLDNVLFSKNLVELVAYLPGLGASYTVPDGVTTIDDGAFAGCSNLTSVTFPATLNQIGYEAFCGCSALNNVVLPDSLYSIGGYAFGACGSLKSITVPVSVAEIGQCGFMSSDSSLNVYYGGSEDEWKQIECVLYDEELLEQGLVIRNDTVSFADSGMAMADMANVTIHYNSASAAQTPANPTSGKCGDNLTWSVADGTLTVSGTGDMYDYSMSAGGVMTNLRTLAGEFTTLVVESGVTGIGDEAFSYSGSLERVVLPRSVTDIGFMAFGMCNNLSAVFYEGSMEDWGKIAIDEWNEPLTDGSAVIWNNTRGIPTEGQIGEAVTWKLSGKTLTFTGTGAMYDSNYGLARATGDFTSAEISTGITRIGDSVFCYAHDLASVTIPATVTEIASLAFYDCPALTDVYYGGTEAQWKAVTVGTGNDALTAATVHYTDAAAPAVSFPDVPADAYYADAVNWAVENKITTGTDKGTFAPADIVNRAMAVTFLWRLKGGPDPTSTVNPFTDVSPDTWYYKAVLWANENNITNGTGDGKFSPDDPVSRGSMITFLWRTLGKPGDTGITDPARWAEDAEKWAGSMDLSSGTAEDYATYVDCPRCDVVFYLWKALAE